jgi:hypothetical protein
MATSPHEELGFPRNVDLLEQRIRAGIDLAQLEESKHIHTMRGPLKHRELASGMRGLFDPTLPTARRAQRENARKRVARKVAQVKTSLFSGLSDLEKSLRTTKTAATPRQRQAAKTQATNAINKLKATLRTAYMDAYLNGIRASGMGDVYAAPRFLSAEEQRWVKSAYIHEMRFFNRLIREIELGKPVASLRSRIDMYGDTVKSLFDSGIVAGAHPQSLIYWIRDKARENCADCIELEKNSPYTPRTVPTTPKAGLTRCLSRCCCTLVVKKGLGQKVSALVATQNPAAIARRLRDRRAR